MRSVESSDLAKENMERVAASSIQLQTVLLKDPGILVELKRWVATEATNSGQIVDDDSLTDQAIFDRLDHDVSFRSVATRLVQRYGYLLPSVNPDSDIAKEQDLIMKERIRRLAQRQEREDQDALAEEETGKNQDQSSRVERTTCDPRSQANCTNSSTVRGRQRGNSQPDENQAPENTPPLAPDQLSPSGANRTLRTAMVVTTLSLAAIPAWNRLRSLQTFPVAFQVLESGNLPPTGMDGIDNLMQRNNLDDLTLPAANGNRTESATASTRDMNRTTRLSDGRGFDMYTGRDRERDLDKDLVPVKMVHQSNPYADIPSLYDMYVQAAPRDREPERFGTEIFRNGTRAMDAIPMDLPVGPDYVVGPGDGLSINLWGGVSQRMVRAVDREGRINLPEAGPLLVSGRTLGEVQESVQQVLRTQFRDVSADVSLSRLRTIRVYVVGEVAEPGAYDISSLSTPLNALFAAGGITAARLAAQSETLSRQAVD